MRAASIRGHRKQPRQKIPFCIRKQKLVRPQKITTEVRGSTLRNVDIDSVLRPKIVSVADPDSTSDDGGMRTDEADEAAATAIYHEPFLQFSDAITLFCRVKRRRPNLNHGPRRVNY